MISLLTYLFICLEYTYKHSGTFNKLCFEHIFFSAFRNCKNIHSIPEDVDSLYEETNLRDVEKKIKELQNVMKAIKEAKEAKGQELRNFLHITIDTVKAFKQELQTLLDNIEQETITEITKEVCALEANLEAEIKEAEKVIDSLNELHSQLKKSEGNKAQEFVCVKSSKKLTDKVTEQEKTQQCLINEIGSFTADQTIKTFLLQIQKLGKFEGSEKMVPKPKPETTPYKVKLKREISVKLVNDTKSCCIYGCCDTNEGSLLLADSNNKKLKYWNMATETVTDYVEFQTGPFAVCKVSETEAAVTFMDNIVQFVSHGGKMATTRSFTATHKCYRLAHYDRKLFIADEGKTVYIHDIQGQELQKVSTGAFGSDLFKAVRQIVLSADGSKVFVADNTIGLITLDSRGKYMSTCTLYNDLGLVGICTDGRNVFVGGHKSNNIVQIGFDFQPLGELVKLNKPVSICFNHHTKVLYATQSENNNVTVLELE